MQIDTLFPEQEQPGIRTLITQLTEKINQLSQAERDALSTELSYLKAQLSGNAEISPLPILNEARYQSLFEQMSEGFALHEIICDENGQPVDYRFLDINPAFEQLTGLKREAVVGRLKSDVLPGETSEWEQIYGQVVQSGEPVRFEKYSTTLLKHYEVFAYRPAPGLFATLFVDTTQRKRIQHEAEEGKRLLDILMEYIPEGITIADTPNARIRMVSRYSIEKLGRDIRALTVDDVFKGWKMYYPDGETEVPADEQPMSRAIQKGETIRDEEEIMVSANGERLSLLCSAAPILGDAGEITGGIVTWHDITARKQVEEALRVSEERFRLASKAMSGIVYDWDMINDTVYRSTRLKDLLGYDPDDMPPGSGWWSSLIHPEDRPRFQEHKQRIAENRVTQFTIDYRIRHKDGHYLTFEDNGFILRDQNGNPFRTVGVNTDITARKRAEEDLRLSEERFRLASLAIPGIVYDCDLVHNTIFRSKGIFETIGYHPYEVPQGIEWWIGLIHPEDRDRQQDNLDKMMSGNKDTFNSEYRVQHKDGHWVYLLDSSFILRDEHGKPVRMVGFSNDISARKQYEDSLLESQKRERSKVQELEAMLDATPAFVWIAHDRESRMMTGNRHAYEAVRMQPGQNISRSAPSGEGPTHFVAMQNGQEIPTEELPVQLAAGKGIVVRDYEFDLVFTNGEIVSVMGNAQPLFDEEGNPRGAVSAFIDITERKRIEKAYRESVQQQAEHKLQIEVQRRLQEYRERERREIARDIHDGPIQTLMSVLINLQLTKEMIDNSALQLELEATSATVRTAVHELRDVVNQLRPPALIRFGLARSISLHAEDFREKHPNYEIELALPHKDREMGEALILTLFRIYQEALNNVVRHAHAGHLRVRYAFENEQAVLEIQDDGTGFSVPKDLLQQTQLGHYGLAGMKERAETVGGEFALQSKPGAGTTVMVRAPLNL
jgi:PAS domain S-box-containing protein